MEAKAKQKKQPMNSLSMSKEDEEKVKRSLQCEVRSEDLQNHVQSILSQMSKEEIMEARDDLLKSLDPSLISFLQKRSAYKDSLKNEQPIKNERDDNDVIRGQQIANTIDYSQIKTEKDLEAAVSLLPESEQQKLAWTKPIRETKESKGIRFHFDGFIIPATSSYASHSGLYNHGDEGDKAGYTVNELVLLGRSAVSGQRVLALKCIYNILRRRSLAILYQQELKPKTLPIDLIHLLLFILQRKAGMEETFWCVKCLEECSSCQEELYRRLLLNCTYRGYEHAHLPETSLLAYTPNDDDDNDDDEEKDSKNPFRRSNCNNVFTVFSECNLVQFIFQCIKEFDHYPSIVNPCLNLLRILVESDKRFSDVIINETSLFVQMEKLLCEFLSPSILPSSPLAPQPTDENLSLRLFFLMNHSQSSFSTTLYALLFMESFCRHNRRNAMNLYRSKVFSVLKEWLLFFEEDHSDRFTNSELNAVMEGVLSVWRIFLNYGLDEDGIDPFLPHLLRLSQFSCVGNRVLVWEILEISILHKKNVSAEYFIDFNNSMILLIVELFKLENLPQSIEAAMIHYFATYIEVVNESMERWVDEGITDSVLQSIQTQIVQLGYNILHLFQNLPSSLTSLQKNVVLSWNQIKELPEVLTVKESEALNSSFSVTELQFLLSSNAMAAVSRLVLAGIQNSRSFSAMLRECGWIDLLLSFSTHDFWESVKQSPHSITYTYLPRLFILSQVNALITLHTLLPTETSTMSDLKQTNRYQVWKASWRVIQSILPGDEYVALELLIHVLLDPVSIKLYLEHHKEDASVSFDLDCLSELLMQQLGEGKLLEHSQSLHLNEFTHRISLRLLPYSIQPSLPLLPYWFCMPFLKLRFRSTGSQVANPFTVSNELQTLTLLRFVKEMEEVLGEEDRIMRYYCLIHLVFAGMEIVSSKRVEEAWRELAVLFKESPSSHNKCLHHRDYVSCLEESVPKQEVLGYLNKVCGFITDEYYFTPFVFEFILPFMYPCRDWNYRVLLLNYFLDNNYAYLLLKADHALLGFTDDCGLEEQIQIFWKENHCWETNEEMIEMFLRYFEQASKWKNLSVSTRFFFYVIYYISKEYPRYGFFRRELERLFPFVQLNDLFKMVMYCCLLTEVFYDMVCIDLIQI